MNYSQLSFAETGGFFLQFSYVELTSKGSVLLLQALCIF